MAVITTAARLLLAIVFVVSAVAKWRDRDSSRSAVEAFGVPRPLVGLVATVLPVVELACAALLLLGDPGATTGSALSLTILAIFTIAIVVNLARGRRPQCHCFGSLGSTEGISWRTAARNAALMTLAALPLLNVGEHEAVTAEIWALPPSDRWLFLLSFLLGAAVLAFATVTHTLMARYGEVLLRLDHLEQATGLAEPKDAPDFTLPDLEGSPMRLDDALGSGRPALLTFISPRCSNCADLLPDLLRWQADPEHPVSVLVISDGSAEDNREKLRDVAALRVLLQDGTSLSDAYEVLGTPAGVVVGVDGRVAGKPAHSADHVRDLHDRMVNAVGGGGHAHQHDHAQLSNADPAPRVVGDVLPDLTLQGEHGPLPLQEAVGSDAVLLFWRTDCGFCRSILDDVLELERTSDLRIISTSETSQLRDSGITSPLFGDPARALERWLEVPGTPCAVAVRDGALSSHLAVGGPATLELLSAARKEPAHDAI